MTSSRTPDRRSPTHTSARAGFLDRHATLISVVRAPLRRLPIAAAGGLIAAFLEGFGLALLLPLLALLSGTGDGGKLPEPLNSLAVRLGDLELPLQVTAIGAAIIALIALKSVVQIGVATIVAKLRSETVMRLQTALADKMMLMDYRHIMTVEPGRLVKITNTDASAIADILLALGRSIGSLAFCLIFGAMLVYLDWQLTVLAVLLVLPARWVFTRTRARLYANSASIAELDSQIMDRSVSLVRSMRAVRIFGRRNAELEKFGSLTRKNFDRNVSTLRVLATMQPQMELLMGIVLIAILAVGTARGLTFPEISLFLVLLYRLQPQLRTLVMNGMDIASRRGAVGEVEWMLDLDEEPGHGAGREMTDGEFGPLDFSGVAYDYPNGTPALRDASFSIPPRGATALLGPSGSGKSTVIALICRFISPDTGRISIGGVPLQEFELTNWRSQIAVAGQDIDLTDGSVAFNIAYGRPDASHAEVEEVARIADAHGFIEQLPQGYDTPVGSSGVSLSGGQRQRIGIARALLKRPKLLIFDEATSAVDLVSEGVIMRLLTDGSHFQAALVVSHRPSTVASCSNAVVLRDGRVIESGPLVGLRHTFPESDAPSRELQS